MYGLSREVSAVRYRIVTTNAEKSAEAEVADFAQAKAKGRIICNVNRKCMFPSDCRQQYEPKRKWGGLDRVRHKERVKRKLRKTEDETNWADTDQEQCSWGIGESNLEQRCSRNRRHACRGTARLHEHELGGHQAVNPCTRVPPQASKACGDIQAQRRSSQAWHPERGWQSYPTIHCASSNADIRVGVPRVQLWFSSPTKLWASRAENWQNTSMPATNG